jgi:hypothetical protein
LLESLESGNEGDACFKVGQKTLTVIKHLISRRAPALGDMAASQPPGSVIPIDNVNPEVFGVILHFIYTDETPESTDPRSVLEVADRFGCSHLKLIAEAEIVTAGILTNRMHILVPYFVKLLVNSVSLTVKPLRSLQHGSSSKSPLISRLS